MKIASPLTSPGDGRTLKESFENGEIMKLTNIGRVFIISLSSILLSSGSISLPASASQLADHQTVFQTSSQGTGPYLHFNCGSQTQCGMVWGAMVGVYNLHSSNQCQVTLKIWGKQNLMQVFNGKVGAWCDHVSSRTEKRPGR